MRNEWVFNHTPFGSARIWSLLKSLGMEQRSLNSAFLASLHDVQGQHRGTFDCSPPHRAVTGWLKPDVGWVKVNLDGAVSSSLASGCGGVICNAGGNWVKGFSRNLGTMATTNTFLTKLLAVLTALEVMMSLDIPQAIVETDSMEVLESLVPESLRSQQYEHIIRSILQLQADHGAIVF